MWCVWWSPINQYWRGWQSQWGCSLPLLPPLSRPSAPHPQIIQAVKSNLWKIGKQHNLHPYELPPSLLLEPTPFSLENRLLTPLFEARAPSTSSKISKFNCVGCTSKGNVIFNHSLLHLLLPFLLPLFLWLLFLLL